MTSVTCVQPLLVVPSLSSAWNVVQSLTRRYTNDTNVRSHVRKRPPTQVSQNATPTHALPQEIPDWVQHAYNGLDVSHLSVDDFRHDDTVNRLMGKSTDPRQNSFATNSPSNRISAATFFENRFGFPEQFLGTSSSSSLGKIGSGLSTMSTNLKASELLSSHASRPFETRWLGRQTSVFFQQTRGFKTRRSTTSAGLGQQRPQGEGVIPSFKELRASPLFDWWNVGGGLSGPKTSDRFQSLLSEADSSSTSAKDKMKIAFAEGYAASDRGRVGTSMSKRLARMFLFGVTVWFLFQIANTYTALGGDMKINVLKGDRFEINPEDIAVTFDDVKGVDEAKQELSDIVDYLRNPEKFKVLGAKLPKGVLLVGPPGIGKSLLARAVAGEAGVPFFHASGSEFDEVFVGTGAKRVRQLFDAAKARAPCIVFIDEIDTVGAKRTSSQIHPYANQTINQLLSEMDGFTQNEGVIVLGATNRRDNLDKALLRPGRFDVEVRVFPPDLKGRKDIIDHYLTKVKFDVVNVDVDKIARGTTGCTGADLENMVNQAALKAAMDGHPAVTMVHLEHARDKVLMGPAKKSKIPDDETNQITAYHEAGHTLVAYYTRDATPLNKVTIIPRGMSLGHTSFVPDKEEYNITRSQLMASMDVAMGGRVAEEMIYGADKVTTGASSDFQTATAIATAMVKRWGMSDKIGVRVFQDEDIDTGVSFLKLNEVGPAVTDIVDTEIKRLLQESYERARTILKTHQSEHRSLALALLKHETLSYEEVKAIVEGRLVVTN